MRGLQSSEKEENRLEVTLESRHNYKMEELETLWDKGTGFFVEEKRTHNQWPRN